MRISSWTKALLAGALLAGPAAGAAEPPASVLGIDVSHYSGSVDWQAVRAAGYAFAYVKATEGVDSTDPAFPGHWERLAASGLHRGAYHFYVTEDDPEEQARFFLSVVELGPGDLPPVVDVEVLGHDTAPGLPGRIRTFLEIVERATGVRPIIYTGPSFWAAHVGEGFGDYPLWLAEYGTETPKVPGGWERWTLWQWQGDATVPGVEKNADLSRLHPEVALHELRIAAGE